MSTSPAAPLHWAGKPRSRRARLLYRLLDQHLQCGSLEVQTPEGELWRFQSEKAGPQAHWRIHDWRSISQILRDGDVGMGRSYFQGLWDSNDPVQLISLALRNRNAVEAWIQGSWWRRSFFALLDRLRANTLSGSQKNIAAHYDLGNDFYQLWLDPSMSYSSACFSEDADESMEQAQERKYAIALASLRLRPGATILEIGCGWGAFAEYAARQGYRVHGITLSREQLHYGQERLKKAGLADLASLEYRDYRNVAGSYDGIVSIEMFEAVGREWWPTYFQALTRLLRRGGRAVVQSIDIADELYPQYCRGSDFIRRHVFPGGFLPSPKAFHAELRSAQLQVLGRRQFGQDYARTLHYWRTRFDAQSTRLSQMGYEQSFQRLWRFYLAYCEAGFREGSINVGQWTLAHA